jgi:hypothetical protein
MEVDDGKPKKRIKKGKERFLKRTNKQGLRPNYRGNTIRERNKR